MTYTPELFDSETGTILCRTFRRLQQYFVGFEYERNNVLANQRDSAMIRARVHKLKLPVRANLYLNERDDTFG